MSEVQDMHEGTSNRCSQSQVRDDTQVSSKSFFYTWTVSNFLECIKLPNSKILSPEFEFEGVKWRLWLQAIRKSHKLDKIKIRLMKSEKCGSGHYIKYTFSILNADGSSTCKEDSSLFYTGSHLGHRLMFKYNDKNKSAPSCIINDKLTVHCELFVLSSEISNDKVTVNDQISANQTSTQSIRVLQKHANKAKNYPSRGLIRSGSNSQVPKNANIPKRPSVHSFSRAVFIDEDRKGKFLLEFIVPICVMFILLLSLEVIHKEGSMNEKFSLNLNMTEVNDLILDSTLKIRIIAEALNLTEIKMKSSELLSWYNKNYNMSDRNFPPSEEKISPFVISDDLILNVSSVADETAVVNNTKKFIDDEY